MERLNAFILAAGLGERLKPITDHIPKPLLPICGKPILESVLGRVSSLSPDIIGINTYHKPEQFENWRLSDVTHRNIIIYHETALLGTGGALKNAESLLRNSSFIVHNADILTDIDLAALVKSHRKSGNIATLAVHDHEKFNNVWIDNKGLLKSVGKAARDSRLCKTAFMGIAVYSPEILNYLPEGRSGVVDAWLKSVDAGNTVGTVNFSGAAWTDIGTPDAYAAAVFDTLKKDGETIYVHESVDCSRTALGCNIVIEEGATIQGSPHLGNSILLPGAMIATEMNAANSIVGPGFSIPVSAPEQSESMPLTRTIADWYNCKEGPVNATAIGAGGSDRSYYRIKCHNKTAVLMKCSEADPDFNRHITYTRFFRQCSLPVPEMFVADEMNRLALFEDLGDLSLYSWLKCSRSAEEIENLYRKILDIVVQIQAEAAPRITECPMLLERVFDYGYLRWETSYFMERFIKAIKQINNSGPALAAELDRLARDVDAFPKTLLHRDLQSQNIMIMNNSIPRLIDYQGARLGPAAYDIASILWDPYYCLEENQRDRLLEYFIISMRRSLDSFSEPDFRKSLLPCRLQRHMQALGAYGFLSKEKGKTHFLKHVPQAIRYLKQETAMTQESYPCLHALTETLL